ncbi:MAG: cation-translocating P-type ATPase, partial [Curvibacter sp.]|nr:cation-translocating P-type ATPase [Curvibacter sp.]
CSCSGHDRAAPIEGGPPSPQAGQDRSAPSAPHRYRIANMDCASEEAQIRRALEDLPGLRTVHFNLGRRELGLAAEGAALEQALTRIRQAGFHPEALQPDAQPPAQGSPAHGAWRRQLAALALALGAESLAFAWPDQPQVLMLGRVLAASAIALAGFSVYGKGLAALARGRLNIDALMTVAVSGAFLIGQWPEAAMVMALYAIAEAIEARAVDRAREAIQSLWSLAPEQAEVQDAQGGWSRREVKTVPVGALVRVRPGERVPLDGEIVLGEGSIDQSPVTGESLPVDKRPGDPVFAGTLNQTAALELRVTAPASDSTLARIIHAVEQAQSSRAPTQRFVDRFAAGYTPAVFVLALAVALLPPWLLDWSWPQALYKALVMLVIACPCALVISTPVTVVSGLTAAARRGILIKGGAHLEQARSLQVVALDKTGTLTEGRPQLAAFEPLDSGSTPEALQALARSLAVRSDHPVAQAIAQGLAETPVQAVDSVEARPGRGVQGRVEGRLLLLANHRWIEELGQCSPELEARLAQHEQAGRTVSLLADSRQVLAICAVADRLKPSSARAVAELRALGVTPVMLTGDNPAAARQIASQAGIAEVRAGLLPEEKQRALAELQQRLGKTAMVGDGINDAPALAQADLGVAMGAAGSHTAVEAADVVVMNDDLRRLPETIRLSRRTHAVLWQNIALALGIKLLFLLLALFDNASMWMAVFADMGASLLVVFNGMRLLGRP